ncbi:MAG: hypothetical protein ACLUOI_30480 [Eisenbergiella sp.]
MEEDLRKAFGEYEMFRDKFDEKTVPAIGRPEKGLQNRKTIKGYLKLLSLGIAGKPFVTERSFL